MQSGENPAELPSVSNWFSVALSVAVGLFSASVSNWFRFGCRAGGIGTRPPANLFSGPWQP